MTTTEPTISLDLLKTFCGKDETRIVLTQPFSDEQWTYATDGRILIRVPKMDHPPLKESESLLPGNNAEQMVKRCQEIFAVKTDDGNFMDLPKEPEQGWGEICFACNGSGKTQDLVCEHCGCVNEGVYDSERECENCYDGRNFKDLKIRFGEQLLNPVYLRKLAKLPGVKAAQAKDKNPCAFDSITCAITFVFDGHGEGRLMPMRK